MSLEKKLTQLADVIREKLGVETTFTLDEMADAILSFELGEQSWTVHYPAIDITMDAAKNLDKPSVTYRPQTFKTLSSGEVNALIESDTNTQKSCNWVIDAPPQGCTFSLEFSCTESGGYNSGYYFFGIVKADRAKRFSYTTINTTNVGDNGLCYKNDPFSQGGKREVVDIALEGGKQHVINAMLVTKGTAPDSAAVSIYGYRITAPETELTDGIVFETGEIKDESQNIILTDSLENDSLPFKFEALTEANWIGRDERLIEIMASGGKTQCAAYSFTPPYDISMYIDAAVSSEKNYDFGIVIVDTKRHSFYSVGAIKSWKSTELTSDGYLSLQASGEVLNDDKQEMKLKGGKTYYLVMAYGKDSSGDKGDDMLIINNIRFVFKKITDTREYHLSKHHYKMKDAFPDTYTTLTDDILPHLDYTLCTTYEEMFDGCAGLTKITLDISNVPLPGGLRNIVRGCTNLKEITFTGLTADSEALTGELIGNTTAILDVMDANGKSFRRRVMTEEEIAAVKAEINSKQTLTIPDGITEIPDEAFAGTQKVIKKITIPATVRVIGKKAFHNCHFNCDLTANGVRIIKERAFSSSSKAWGSADIEKRWRFPSLDTVETQAFYSSSSWMTAVYFYFGSKTHAVTSIAEDAFKNFCGYTARGAAGLTCIPAELHLYAKGITASHFGADYHTYSPSGYSTADAYGLDCTIEPVEG